MFSNLLFAAIGGAIGAVACYLWRNARVASLQTELQGKEASHKTEIENLRSLYEQQIEHLKITEEKLQTTFKAAAETVLDQGAKRYEKSAEKDLQRITAESEGKIELKKQAIDSTVKELKDQLKNAGDKISEFEKERTDKYAKIEQQIGNLFNQEQKLIEETQHLKSALTTSNAVRGKWGELVLRNILQLSDLTEGVDYTIQKSTTNDDGTRIRPDCVLKLPNSNSYVAIDAKASLYESYLAASGSITEEQRIEIHKDFAGKLRGRMKDLTKKEYQDYVTDSVPYVIMFIPSEAAMRAALEVDQSLLVDCAKQKVILTSPATLMPLIFLIADAWRQHRIATQAAVLTEEVKELGKRLERFIGRLGGVQKGIEAASKAWNEAISQSWMGRLSVVRSFDKIKEMGNLLPQLSDPSEVTIEPVVIPISDTPQLLSEQS